MDEVFRCGCAGHCSSLASSGGVGRGKDTAVFCFVLFCLFQILQILHTLLQPWKKLHQPSPVTCLNVSSDLIHLTSCPPVHGSGRVSVFFSSPHFPCFFLQRWAVNDLLSHGVFFSLPQANYINTSANRIQYTCWPRKKKVFSSQIYDSIHLDASASTCPSPTLLRHFPPNFKAVGSALFQPPAPPDLITALQYM